MKYLCLVMGGCNNMINSISAVYTGFDVKLFKPGSVFYIDMGEKKSNYHSPGLDRNPTRIVGNIFVMRCTPQELEFKDLSSFRNNTNIIIDYRDIEDGIIKIHEIRELK